MCRKYVLLIGIAVVTLLNGFAQAKNSIVFFPQAEWDTAKVILMHTPELELFDGVIHPAAGLFEHYFDAFGHDTVIVVKDHRFWQMQMHLDTHFNIIDYNLCTMVASRYRATENDSTFVTADVYVRQPGTTLYTRALEDVGFVQLLQQRGFKIIPIDESDEWHYANNFLTIAPRHIMAVDGQSQALQQAFEDNGVRVEWVPLENLIDAYGAAHCMTQVLRRTPVSNIPIIRPVLPADSLSAGAK